MQLPRPLYLCSAIQERNPEKISSLPEISSSKVSDSSSFSHKKPSLKECLPSGLREGLVLAASVINGGTRSLTYEEALQQSVGSLSSGDFDANGVLNSVISFGTENAVIIAVGLAILGVPLVLSQVLNAYAKLGADENAQLLDLRTPVESPREESDGVRPFPANFVKAELNLISSPRNKMGQG